MIKNIIKLSKNYYEHSKKMISLLIFMTNGRSQKHAILLPWNQVIPCVPKTKTFLQILLTPLNAKTMKLHISK